MSAVGFPASSEGPRAAGRRGSAPRIALIGCGAFAEAFYLPAFARRTDVLQALTLVDTDAQRARSLAARFQVPRVCASHQDVAGEIDGAIVAASHHLHYAITMDLLARGVHVLCEKPVAFLPEHAEEMVAQAEKSGVALATNHTQRLFPSNRKVKELVTQGALGHLSFIRYTWGAEFTWPTASGFYLNPRLSHRCGVLLDRGPHALDLISWWLGAQPEVVVSENDSLGGLEAMAYVRLRANGCEIEVKLSWLGELDNTYLLRGERAEIENGFQEWWQLSIRYKPGAVEFFSFDSPEQDYEDFGEQIVDNFLAVIRSGAAPLIPASEVLPSIRLVHECYAKATCFPMPWYENLEVARATRA